MNHEFAALVLVSTLALSPAVLAGQAPNDAAQACLRLTDRSQRLDCYDALFGRPADQRAPAPESQAPAIAEETFGLTQQQIDSRAPESAAPKTDSIASSVAELKRAQDGKFTVKLANGQVWTQIEINTSAVPRIGDAVTIRRAAMGSFLLVTPRGSATRVRRLD
jgi:hypothetical protein